MKRLSLLVLGLLALPCVALADTLTLKDGTKLEGEIRRSGDKYTVKTAKGVTDVPVDKVLTFELKAQPGGGDALMSRLQSLHRAAENMADARQVVDRYRTFIDQNPNTPAATAAEREMILWQERADKGMIKVGGSWMTPAERDGLRAKSVDVAINLHDLLKQGQMKQSTALIEKSLQIDPHNPSFLYLHGVMQYMLEFLPLSRTSFEAVLKTAPDHAPTLNNLAVILWRQHAITAALGYYDRAMLAAPASREILDNVAEALNSLPKEMRDSFLTKKVVRHFKEQDDVLQKKMAEVGLYRWGSSWVNDKELKKLQDEEKVIKNQITQMGIEFDGIQRQIAKIDEQIGFLTNQMGLLEAQTFGRDANGQPVRFPYPPAFFTLSFQRDGLRAQRAGKVDELENLRKAAKKAQSQLPAPKYGGLQKIIDYGGMPLPAGARLPAPPPPLPPVIPPAAPGVPPPGPAPVPPLPNRPATQPAK